MNGPAIVGAGSADAAGGWDPQFAARSPIFAPLREPAGQLAPERWPDVEQLNALASRAGLRNARGLPLRFVAPAAAAHQGYERQVWESGEVPTRPANWHDLFNALAWFAFPAAKAALNAAHLAAMGGETGPNRSPRRDALTLFDESGVIVACADAQLEALLRGFCWKALFWENRSRLPGLLQPFVFGHALYEKALSPFVGMTGMSLVVPVAPSLFTLPLARQVAALDAAAAALIADAEALPAPAALAPLPVLGYPGWYPAGEDEAFYEDTRYFRPGRRARTAS